MAAMCSGCATTARYDQDTLDVLAAGGLVRSRANVPDLAAKLKIFGLDQAAQPCQLGPADQHNLRDDFKGTLQACGNVLAGYEAKAADSRILMLALAAVGTIAGSVVVPALAAKAVVAKSTIAAWGGISGATNFAQQAVVNEGLAPNDLVKTREGIRADLRKAIDEYTDPASDYCAQARAIAKMAAACTAYAIQTAHNR